MESVLVSDFVAKVRAAIDENEDNSEVLATEQSNIDLTAIIRHKILDAVRWVHLKAPQKYLDGTSFRTTPPVKNADGSGYVPLPQDYMRFVIFRMVGWRRAVVMPLEESDSNYSAQKNLYTRGNIYRPVCVVSTSASGAKIVEYYSLPADQSVHVIDVAQYIPLPAFTGDGDTETVDICQQVIPAAVYMCAALTLTAFNSAQSNVMMNLATTMLE